MSKQTLEERVKIFKLNSTAFQRVSETLEQIIDMGVSSLVEDLWAELQELRSEQPRDKVVVYEHKGMMVSVKNKYKGKHKDICLCHTCEHFKPDTLDNCIHAEIAYTISKDIGIALVMECKFYKESNR